MSVNVFKIHELLKPLSWIIGEWRSISAVVTYPTMKTPIHYNEKLSFVSLGRPFLSYSSVTWNKEDGSPMHSESGFLKIDEDGKSVAFLIAQAFGVATVEGGSVNDYTILTKSSCIGHAKFVKHKVVSIQRCYKLNEQGQLEYSAMMETQQTPLTQHIIALYEKCT